MASYTDKQKNELTKQYEPLINKLTGQFYSSVQMDWDSIKSMAYEGFALALNKYDESKSSMSFMSFAAFEMRNNIMTRLTEESRTVKLPFEEQKRRKESGEPLFNSVSIDRSVREDDDIKPREIVMGMYETARFADGDVFSYLYERLEEKFPQRECDMFYMSFGLKGFEDTPNQDIAKKFGVSEGLVSQKKRKIIDWIRTDRDLCEMLSNLV
jgi:RNA polymerase sigma factor (sigma-70 family)